MHKIQSKIFLFLIFISFIFINSSKAGELDYLDNAFDSESLFGIEEPEEFKNQNSTLPELKLLDKTPRVPKPIGGWGSLHVIIESVDAFNHSLISKKADRVEIWLGHLLLQRLDLGDVKVSDGPKFRIFDFPNITLKTGYHFISVRMYSNGVIWKNKKFHEKIYQVGIHEGQVTTLHRKVPFINW